MDTVTKEVRSAIMRAIKGKNTQPEQKMAAALARRRFKFVQWAELPGKPDFYMPRHKLVVDVFGCYWHACPKHYTMPRSNGKFWRDKIRNNRKRDRRVLRSLRAMGFTVLRFWECEVNKDADRCAGRVAECILGGSNVD